MIERLSDSSFSGSIWFVFAKHKSDGMVLTVACLILNPPYSIEFSHSWLHLEVLYLCFFKVLLPFHVFSSSWNWHLKPFKKNHRVLWYCCANYNVSETSSWGWCWTKFPRQPRVNPRLSASPQTLFMPIGLFATNFNRVSQLRTNNDYWQQKCCLLGKLGFNQRVRHCSVMWKPQSVIKFTRI